MKGKKMEEETFNPRRSKQGGKCIMNYIIAVVGGTVLDALIGDPGWSCHPVVLIGKLISFIEKAMRRLFPKTERGEAIGGFVEVVVIALVSFAVPFVILRLLYHCSRWLGLVAEIVCCGLLLAGKSLRTESMKVYDALQKEGLEQGRYAVSMIVGRDTPELTEQGVIKAAVETVAENNSDGFVAPAFYMILGGAPLMFLYKTINTMDSMLGYKNDRYLHFGRTAAKLDDAANFIPSRLAGCFMIIATALAGFNAKKALEIYRRDRHNHSSPNAAQTESVMAGALELQLAGDMYYFGKRYKKKTIGDNVRPIEVEDIVRANRLATCTSWLSMGIFVMLRFLFFYLLHR